MLVVGLGLGAALLLAVGFVLQQHVAAQEPPDEAFSIRLLLHLIRRPLWLAGIGAMILGQLLGATALDNGDLSVVEPLLAANLVFALPLAAVWSRSRLGIREWVGAVVLAGGLGGFLVAAAPGGGSPELAGPFDWVTAGGAVVIAAGALFLVGKRFGAGARQATCVAAAGGVLFGLQDALTRRTLTALPHGMVALFTQWPTYALLVVAVAGLLLVQSAFEEAPLSASLPALTAAEPLAGIALGAGLYGENLRLTLPYLPLELLCLVAMVVGVFLVARSPVVTGVGKRAEAARAAPETREPARVGGKALGYGESPQG